MASTTQLYNPTTGAWSEKLRAVLGLKKSLFPKIVPSGTVLGPVIGPLKSHASLAQAQVIATCSHDTGAAVAAVPAVGKNWAYLSSGTWSLLGAELPAPVVTAAAREAGFTNEVGLGGTIRFLKNIAGLWVLQESRRAWEAAGESFSYEELTRLAVENGPAQAHISLQDPRFLSPGAMPEKISSFCRETGPAGSRDAGPIRPHDPGKPGADLRADPAPAGRPGGAEIRETSHRRRRQPQPPAQPSRGGRHRIDGPHRTGRGDGHRQCSHSGVGAGTSRIDWSFAPYC